MGYQYTTVNGHRVEANVADAFHRMAADFKRDTGVDLRVASGTRTNQEQRDIFLARYVTQGNTNGRKIYDSRFWEGRWWFRVVDGGTVAVPGKSNHEEFGPNGPRSLDLYDTGQDAGVRTRGTVRDKWMERNAGKYGFENEGYQFDEAWHKTFRGALSNTAPAPATAGDSAVGATTRLKSPEWVAAVQRKYHQLGHDLGSGGVDGIDGPRFVAITRLVQAKGGLAQDGVAGDDTNAYLDRVLSQPVQYPPLTLDNIATIGDVRGLQKIARSYGYKGPIDNDWGAGSKAGFGAFLKAKWGGSAQAWLRSRWGYVGDDLFGPDMRAALQRANSENFRVL